MKSHTMNRWPVAGCCLLALMLGTSRATLHAQEVARYVFADDRVAVYNLAGVMRVQPGTGAEVVVELVRGGDDARQLRVETGRIDGRGTLRVLYPGDRVVYPAMDEHSRTTLRVREDGTFFSDDGGERGDRVTIVGSGSGLEAFADVRLRIPDGSRVAVYLGVGKAFVTNVNGDVLVEAGSASIETARTRGLLRLDSGSGNVSVQDADGAVDVDTGSGGIEVYRVRGSDLDVETGSGGVEAGDIAVAAVVDVDAGSGSIELGDVQARGLSVETGSGAVDGGDISVEDLEVDTGSGSIDLERVRASEIQFESGSGSVRLGLLADVRNLSIETGSGGVTLTVPLSFNASLELDTGSGGINVDLPLQLIESERNHLLARVGAGTGSIRVETGSGGIRVRGS